MTRHRVIISLIIIFTGWNLYGQDSLSKTDRESSLSLKIKSISFIENNEYYNPIIEGYTLPGFFFQPQLIYTPSTKVSMRAGAHFLKYWGTKNFTQIKPVFSLSLDLSPETNLTIGSLYGSDKHRFFDPHFNNEFLYTAYAEDGFELTTVNDHVFNDAWLNWENFIFKGDTVREVFTFGESFRYTSPALADFIHVEVPVQIQFKHFGGQISNYDEHVETYFNLAAGLRINFDLAEKRYGQAGIEYLQFLNNELPRKPESGITHGYAGWLRFHYTYKVFYFGAAYWKGHNFYSPNGNSIYSSVSDYQANIVIPDRKIITNYFYLTLLPESFLELYLGLETYYDIDLKRMDSSLTLHLNFEKLMKLATLKN